MFLYRYAPLQINDNSFQSITAVGGGGSEELDVKDSPPILSDTTETNKEKQLYPEYFMPVNEYKPQIGEYKKSKKGPSAAKILCWMLSLLLLAGAIVLAVLIGSKSLFTTSVVLPTIRSKPICLVFLTNN